VGFGILSVVVRGGGTAGAPAAAAGLDVSSRISQEASQSQSFFASGSVSPSSAQPQASTHTS
jgi:hypothetical protein